MNAPALAAAVRPGPALSTELMTRLECASRALLSPLASRDADTWRKQVMEAVCLAVGAEQASFVVPGEATPLTSWGLDDQVTTLVGTFVNTTFQGRGGCPEPLVDVFFERLVARNLRVWDMHSADVLLDGAGVAWNNLFHNEVLSPNRMADTNSLFVPMRGGGAHLALHGFLRRPEPGEHLAVLRLLLPAFEAGLVALDRLSAHRAALDALSEPLAVFDVDGRELHVNTALARLLACDPEAHHVRLALTRTALQMRRFGFPRHGEHGGLPTPTITVQTPLTVYTLRATLLPPGMYGDAGAMLVTVDLPQRSPTLPSSDVIRARFGVTKREAETALLVAQGLSNDEIADALFVSRHTVRHHVESIMAKLDLTGKGRGAVASKLLGLVPA